MRTLLFLVTIIGISAVLGAVIVGTRNFDGTVVDKPYERGLAYDAANHEREASGWRVEFLNKNFKTGINTLDMAISGRDNRPLAGAGVMMKVSRPSSTLHDRIYKATVDKRGRTRVDIDLPLYGYWKIEIEIAHSKKTVLFERLVFAEADRKR